MQVMYISECPLCNTTVTQGQGHFCAKTGIFTTWNDLQKIHLYYGILNKLNAMEKKLDALINKTN